MFQCHGGMLQNTWRGNMQPRLNERDEEDDAISSRLKSIRPFARRPTL